MQLQFSLQAAGGSKKKLQTASFAVVLIAFFFLELFHCCFVLVTISGA